jgi:hypothetical protein
VNAATGGTAPRDAVADAPADDAAGYGVTARTRAPKPRTVAGLAKADAGLLSRSALILAGLLAGGVIIWAFAHTEQPLWWNVAWQAGYGQVFLAMAVLASAMMRLPEQRVSQVLAGAWAQWVNWRTTDEQLAAALGIPMPTVPQPPALPPAGNQPDAAPACTGSTDGA